MNEQEITDFIEIHTPGFKGIFKIYSIQLIRESYALRFALFFTLFVFFFILNIETFYSKEFVFKITDMVLNSFPDLLGFNLGCYALIIGLGNSNFLSALLKPSEEEKFSVYQKTIAIFAFSIVLQTVVLLSSFCINFFKDSKLFDDFSINADFDLLVNYTLIILLILFSSWAIALIINLAINIFSFGQTNHFFLRLEEIRLKSKEEAFKLEQERKKQSRKKKKRNGR